MKAKKYLKLENEIARSRPHKPLCTRYKGVEACQKAYLSKLFQWCFLSTHFKQIPSFQDTIGRPITIVSLHRVCNEK